MSVARERVRKVLGSHPLLDNALLVTSELVTNAIVHAAGPTCDLVIGNRAHGVVAVHVLDHGGTGEPRPAPCDDPLCESGRGLDLVRMLGTLTWERTGDTLTVSAVLPKEIATADDDPERTDGGR